MRESSARRTISRLPKTPVRVRFFGVMTKHTTNRRQFISAVSRAAIAAAANSFTEIIVAQTSNVDGAYFDIRNLSFGEIKSKMSK